MAEEKPLILVVDDDKTLSTTLSESLRAIGYSVATAPNGKTGLEMALSQYPNLIILDLQMPEMDGVEMLKVLRADDWGKNVPVILATNIYDVDAINQSMEMGVKDYILKADVSLDAIAERVKKYVQPTQ